LFFTNQDLFNNAFLNAIKIPPSKLEEAISLFRSIRDWYQQADFSDPKTTLRTFIRPVLQNQSLSCVSLKDDSNAFKLTPPWDRNDILGMLYLVPPNEELHGCNYDEKLQKGKHWSIKAINLALKRDYKWLILTNGYQWRLMNSQILHRYDAYFELNLDEINKSNENNRRFQLSIYLFMILFGLDHGFGKDAQTGQQCLDLFYQNAQNYSQKIESYLKKVITDDLGTNTGGDGIMAQLCYGFVRAIENNENRQFSESERNAIFRDATYLLYRLLFLFYAEARGLLPIDHKLYQKLSVKSLVAQAVDILGPSPRFDRESTELWRNFDHLCKLLDIGDIPLQIPAFDGGLFDNGGHEYLEQLQISNIYLAQALVQLAFLHDNKGEIINPIDYRDLSVRHLGSLYEGMIEYRLYIAEEELLARRKKDGSVKYLPASKSKMRAEDEILHQGSIYFAQNSRERKATGTHYTPEELVGKLVQQTVLKELEYRWQLFKTDFSALLKEYEALIDDQRINAFQHYIDHQIIKFVENQILSLRICDPAMGSGHFLVYSAQAITNFIIWVLSRTPWSNPDIELTPLLWRRGVVENCLYGVDINPTAVELAKLSLWLSTLQADYPLSFLDHRLKSGNSLLGVSFEEIINILEESALNRKSESSKIAEARGQYALNEPSHLEKAAQDAVDSIHHILSLHSNTVESVKAQKEEFRTSQEILQAYRDVGDFLVALKMGLMVDYSLQHKIAKLIEKGQSSFDNETNAVLEEKNKFLSEYAPFHWSLEYPEIFLNQENKGFDIIIGNPPFMGGSSISTNFGNLFLKFVKESFEDSYAQADLSAYFFRKVYQLIGDHGFVGMVATNTIAQGDTRRTGLSHLLKKDGFIYYADRFVHWGGDASVEVNLIALQKQLNEKMGWVNEGVLDGESVPIISSWLDDMAESEPYHLEQNSGLAKLGDSIKGIGFVVEPEEAKALIQKNPRNKDCLFLFPNGRDINNDPESRPSRYVICFYDWPLEKAQEYPDLLQIARERVKPQR